MKKRACPVEHSARALVLLSKRPQAELIFSQTSHLASWASARNGHRSKLLHWSVLMPVPRRHGNRHFGEYRELLLGALGVGVSIDNIEAEPVVTR